MKLIIDIPDGMYNSIIENGKGTIMQLTTELYGVLCRATPLPKEHEDLKDKRDMRCKDCTVCEYTHVCDIYSAPTIIKATTEVEK